MFEENRFINCAFVFHKIDNFANAVKKKITQYLKVLCAKTKRIFQVIPGLERDFTIRSLNYVKLKTFQKTLKYLLGISEFATDSYPCSTKKPLIFTNLNNCKRHLNI